MFYLRRRRNNIYRLCQSNGCEHGKNVLTQNTRNSHNFDFRVNTRIIKLKEDTIFQTVRQCVLPLSQI